MVVGLQDDHCLLRQMPGGAAALSGLNVVAHCFNPTHSLRSSDGAPKQIDAAPGKGRVARVPTEF